MLPAPNSREKIKVADVLVSTNYVTFLTNRFLRLISLPTSTVFDSETSGITAILKYRSVNPTMCQKRVLIIAVNCYDTPVGWCYRIHRLFLCREVRLHQRISEILHKTIWCSSPSNGGASGNAEYPFIAIAPRSSLAQSGSTWYVPINGWNRTKIHTFDILNCLK